MDGTNYGSPVTISGGIATSPAINAAGAGSHTITAVYNSDANFTGSTAPGVTQTVTQANTTLALAASTASAVYGQAVTLTATIAVTSPGGGTPAGVVTFTDGSSHARHRYAERLRRRDADDVVARRRLALGRRVLRRQRELRGQRFRGPGDRGRAQLYDRVAHLLGQPAPRPGRRSRSPRRSTPRPPARARQRHGAVPHRRRRFRRPGRAGGGIGDQPAPPARSRAGTTRSPPFTPATSNYTGSTAPALTQTVGGTQTAVATTTTLATSASPAVFGQPVTLTATVAASAGGTPTGTVTFTDSAATLGVVPVDATGHAALDDLGPLGRLAHDHRGVLRGRIVCRQHVGRSCAVRQPRRDHDRDRRPAPTPPPRARRSALPRRLPALPRRGCPSGTVQFVIDMQANFASPVPLAPGGTATGRPRQRRWPPAPTPSRLSTAATRTSPAARRRA